MGLFGIHKDDNRALLSQKRLELQPSYSVDTVSTYSANRTSANGTSAKKKYRLRRPKLPSKFRKLASDNSLYSSSSSSEYIPPEGFLFMVDPPRKDLVDQDDQSQRNVLDGKKKKTTKRLPRITIRTTLQKIRSDNVMSKFQELLESDSKSSISYDSPAVTLSNGESISTESFDVQTMDSAEVSKAQEKHIDQQHTYVTAKSTSIEEEEEEEEEEEDEEHEQGEQEVLRQNFQQMRFDDNYQQLERVETNSSLTTRSSIFSMEHVARVTTKFTPPQGFTSPPVEVKVSNSSAKKALEVKKTPSVDMFKFTKALTPASTNRSVSKRELPVASKPFNDADSIFLAEDSANPFHQRSIFDENEEDPAWSSPFQFASDEAVPCAAPVGRSVSTGSKKSFDLIQSIRRASVREAGKKDPEEYYSVQQRPDPSPRSRTSSSVPDEEDRAPVRREVRTVSMRHVRDAPPPPPPGPPPSLSETGSQNHISSAIMASMAYRRTISTSSRSLALANLEQVDQEPESCPPLSTDVPRVINATNSMDSGVSSLVDSVAAIPVSWQANAILRHYRGGLEKLEAVRENYHMFQG